MSDPSRERPDPAPAVQGPCRICGRPATRRLGERAFCGRHYERALHERRSKRHADLASMAALAAFVACAWLLDRLLAPDLSPALLLATGVLMALVPAAVWLAFFYRRDRLEPEPTGTVIEVFVLGALVAAAIGMPVVERLFDTGAWLYRSPWAHLAGAVLVIGVTQEVLKYAAVRFSVYSLPLFDELTDGIVYASAAGLGYATALNVAFVVESGGAGLAQTAMRVTLTALAQGAFAGVTGYFLARQKLQQRPVWWMPAGLALAATLNGSFHVARGALARGELTVAGGSARPWAGLLLAVGLVAATTLLLSRAMRRDIATARSRAAAAAPEPEPLPHGPAEARSAGAVLGLAAIALALGWTIRGMLIDATRTVQAACVTADVPVHWLAGEAGPESLVAHSPSRPVRRLSVERLADDGMRSLPSLATSESARQASQLDAYRVLAEGPGRLGERAMHRVSYAYLDEGGGGVPVVMVGEARYVALGDGRIVVRTEAEAPDWDAAAPLLDRIAGSVAPAADCP